MCLGPTYGANIAFKPHRQETFNLAGSPFCREGR